MSKTNLKSKQIFKYIIQILVILLLSLTLSLSSFAVTDGNVGDANAGGQGNHNTINIKGGYHVGDAGYRIYIVDANSPTVRSESL